MAIDKENSPGWYKVVVWIVLIAFVLGMVAVGLTWIFNGIGSNLEDPNAATTTTSVDTSSNASAETTINGRYQPQVTAALDALKAKPDDFNANNNVGIAYSLWAQDLMNSGDEQSQAAATSRYRDAVPYLKKASELQPTNSSVANSYILALALSGDKTQALSVARNITKTDPGNAEGWYYLGLLLADSGETNATKDAIAALRTAIEKDTSGTLKASAQQEIDTLNKTQ